MLMVVLEVTHTMIRVGFTPSERDDQLSLYLLLDPGILYHLLCSSVYCTESQYKPWCRNNERPLVTTCINQCTWPRCSSLFMQNRQMRPPAHGSTPCIVSCMERSYYILRLAHLAGGRVSHIPWALLSEQFFITRKCCFNYMNIRGVSPSWPFGLVPEDGVQVFLCLLPYGCHVYIFLWKRRSK